MPCPERMDTFNETLKHRLCNVKLFKLRVCDHRGEWEFPFPSIPGNESLRFSFPNYGNGCFHSLPVPEFQECFFFIPFPFPDFGNVFFYIPFPLQDCGNAFFLFSPRSRIYHVTDKSHNRNWKVVRDIRLTISSVIFYFLQQFILVR